MANRHISKNLKHKVLTKYNKRCAYCGVKLSNSFTIDHINPRAIGGTNTLSNLNPSCRDCNQYKGAATLEEFRKQLLTMLNENLDYLFKSKSKMNVSMNMGTIKHTKWNGKFYFEKVIPKMISTIVECDLTIAIPLYI